MAKQILLGVLFALVLTFVIAKPAGNDLDNVSGDDLSLNAVVEPEKRKDITDFNMAEKDKNEASVQITGISTGIDAPIPTSHDNGVPFRPQRAGSMFARFIDDIFNIPITVLQSVARLLTNPFTKTKTPEEN